MAKYLVHNITNADSIPVDPQSFNVGGTIIHAGESAVIDDVVLNEKHFDLHGKGLWFGDIPTGLFSKKSNNTQYASEDEAHAYLSALSKKELLELNSFVTPSFIFSESTTHSRCVMKILDACFSSKFFLDPEKFYWLRRWKKLPSGDYREI